MIENSTFDYSETETFSYNFLKSGSVVYDVLENETFIHESLDEASI